jgi:leader peptidase (prepilin peptidase) / N-methyltransferase
MNLILAIPMPLRLALLFVLGACAGGVVNWAIYSLAWNSRKISPWSRRDPSAPPRRLADRLPIVGWLGLRRESSLHGRGFWIRPMLLEIIVGIGFAALYWWEIGEAGLLPPGQPQPLPRDVLTVLHFEFAAHLVLIGLMLAGSMIDFDEKTIPDEITLVGTLIGLLMAAAWPKTLLPDFIAGVPVPLHLASPNDWPAVLGGAPSRYSLVLGLACWLGWCMGVFPWSWHRRHGWRRALQLCWARICREPLTLVAILGVPAIVALWHSGGTHWQGLLTALVGMAASGGLVWAVRVVCSAVLQREAMGFGDVTLMAMLGAFLGWQACLMIFFLAPFAGMVLGIVRLLLFRDKEIPYGPFLCLAALFVVIRWDAIWSYTLHVFAVGWLVPAVILCCPPLMALMLGVWRLIARAFR